MGQETSAPIHQRGSQMRLPYFDIEYPKGSGSTTEQEQPEPCDNVKNEVPDNVLDKLSTKVNCMRRTETKEKTPKPLMYRRQPEQLQKVSEEILKHLATIPMKKLQVNVNKREGSKERHGYNGKFASIDRIVSIERNRQAIIGRAEDQL